MKKIKFEIDKNTLIELSDCLLEHKEKTISGYMKPAEASKFRKVMNSTHRKYIEINKTLSSHILSLEKSNSIKKTIYV